MSIPSASSSGPTKPSPTGDRKPRHDWRGSLGLCALALALLALVAACGSGTTTPEGDSSHVSVTIAPAASVTASPAAGVTSTPSATRTASPTPAVATSAARKPAPVRTTKAPAAPVTHAAKPKPAPTTHAPKPAPKPAATTAKPRGCYPLTNGGKCYSPGEYCRNSDHGASGVDGDGGPIKCEDNNGWRWEHA